MLEKQPSENVLANLANEAENFEASAGERPVETFIDENHQRKIKRNEKIAFVSILILSIVFISLSFYQLGNALNVPYAKGPNNPVVAADKTEDSTAPEELSAEEKSALRAKDSDEDTISDFDEIFVYKTSAYLTDSDSDGISDPDEIKAGEDPNCPKGQECFRIDAETIDSINAATPATTSDTASDVDVAKLRQLLIQSGKYTKEQVDAVDDAALLKVYQETMKANPDLQVQAAAPATDTVPLNGTDLTPAQIRELLLEQGVDAEVVNQVDDATLVQMYAEALDAAKTKAEE